MRSKRRRPYILFRMVTLRYTVDKVDSTNFVKNNFFSNLYPNLIALKEIEFYY